MVYYYAYLNSANICEQVYAMPSPISGSNYILLDSYDTSLIGKRYNNGVWEEVTWYYYAKLDDRDIVIEIVSNPDNPLPAQNDLISIPSSDTSLIGKWYNRETEQFVEAPIHVLAMHSTDEINVGTADKWLTTEINEINTAVDNLETALNGKADTAHTHTEATTTAAGFMSASDKAKLDGITGTGLDGEDGASAYEIAVENGFVGTVTEWLASLHGADGADGTDGVNGTNGADGADGADGTTVVVGTTTTGNAGTNAIVTGSLNEETNTLTLNFTIPKGADGADGESGADITASDILTKLKTVDGQNSGLDADMLDGHDTDYFATATQLAGKAAIDHTHTGYAAENHTHSGYAAADHTHSNYAASDHTHTGYATTASVTALETAVSGKADSTHNHDTAYSSINHTHTDYATITALNDLADDVDGKAAANHTHTEYAAASHNHAMAAITGLETALSGKASTDHTHSNYATTDHTHSGYATTDHTHTGYATTASLTVVENSLENKANTSHTHSQSDISGLANALSGKADTTHTHSQYATLSAVYPVGSIYMSVSNANPSTLFGGTWVSFGVGRVLMSVATTENAGITGGNETVTLAAHKHTTAGHVLTLNEIPEHNHALLNYNVDGNTSYTFTKSSVEANIKKGFDGNVTTTYKGGSQSHSHGDTGTAGAATISVVQPYITCYMWKRTA